MAKTQANFPGSLDTLIVERKAPDPVLGDDIDIIETAITEIEKVIPRKIKTDATAAPAVTNDITEGYAVNSLWIDVTNDKAYICVDATDGAAVWIEITSQGVGDALTTDPLSQFAATTSAELAGVISDEIGTGKAVFATSPTLVTPLLGTPTSGVVTNLTGVFSGNLSMDHTLGSDEDYSGITDSAPVGETVAIGDLLYYDWTDVEWKKAKADAIGTTPAMRIALEVKDNGETCLMLVEGYIRDDSAFDFGAARVYLNDDTAGTCDDTAPAESGDQIQLVGIAVSADILWFNPSIDIGEI